MKKILDIGCGTGFRTSRLKKRDAYVVGIDISNENLTKAKKRYKGIKFKHMASTNIKYKNDFFDEIFATDVLEHVDDLDKTGYEIIRVLKKLGLLKIIVPAEKSEKWLTTIRPSYAKEIHHVRIFRANQLENFFKKKGLKLIKKRSQNFLQHLELYYLFKTQKRRRTQLEVGDWRDNPFSIAVHALISLFDPYWVFNTPLVFIPIWLVTLPIGYIINCFGNKVMPKSIYYEFVKI